MARRHQKRRRRGRLSFLYRLVSVLLICGAIVAALTLFFKIETVEISGNERYSEEEILNASGLAVGNNLFLMNKYAAKNSIFKKLPYVASVRINRRLPNTLVIGVTEAGAAAVLKTEDGSLWLISSSGKLLEQVPDAAGYTMVQGGTLLNPEPSAQMELGAPVKQTALLALLAALDGRGMLPQAEEIHLEDDSCVTMRYAGRFTVRLLWTADFDYKMESLSAIIGCLEDNETGTVNMTQDGKVNFIPD